MIWLVAVLVVLAGITVFFLRGPDLGQFDSPPGQSFDLGHEPSDEHDAVVASFDVGLGPMFKGMSRVPKPLLWWFALLQNRMTPRNPLLSPVYGDLSGLCPTLVHASEAEILFDDARRYVNRAVQAGTDARLQSWAHVVHVWRMFYPQLTEARDAWDEIGKFLRQVEGEVDDEGESAPGGAQ